MRVLVSHLIYFTVWAIICFSHVPLNGLLNPECRSVYYHILVHFFIWLCCLCWQRNSERFFWAASFWQIGKNCNCCYSWGTLSQQREKTEREGCWMWEKDDDEWKKRGMIKIDTREVKSRGSERMPQWRRTWALFSKCQHMTDLWPLLVLWAMLNHGIRPWWNVIHWHICIFESSLSYLLHPSHVLFFPPHW